jgi:Amt family ammonium transporter
MLQTNRWKYFMAGFFVLSLSSATFAQAGGASEERIQRLEELVRAAQASGDNAWMLTACALGLLVTCPGLALFYGGLVRRKNVLATLMQSFLVMAVVSLLWFMVTYSLAFAEGNSVFGSLKFAFLRGVEGEPNRDYASTIPHQTFMMFQLMFAIITPALITGAFAERVKFSALLWFAALWSILLYGPLAHLVWGKGGWLQAASGGRLATLDFAGGTVVHISSGISALVCALYIGKRLGYPEKRFMPHNLVLSFLGAGFLWIGWFGFNAGSALTANHSASAAFVTTHFASVAGLLGWLAAEWARTGKPSTRGAVSGALAGLVAITPAAGFVRPAAALVIGLLGGALCFVMTSVVKRRLGYDDALDAFGIHGVAGSVGVLLTGVFATSAVNPVFKSPGGVTLPVGAVDGNYQQLINQAVAVVLTMVIAAIGTLLILKFVDAFIGLRASAKDEVIGLDQTQHGEEAYALDPIFLIEEGAFPEPEAEIVSFAEAKSPVSGESEALLQAVPAQFSEAGD